MNKINNIQVFEYDRLTTDNHPKFKEHHLNALLKLNEYHNFEYFDPIPNGVRFKQHVGIIQVDGLAIEILPKADKDDSNYKWQKLLLEMLVACGKLKASTNGAANVNRKNLNLLEIYFELYLNELDNLIRKGLIKKYRQETLNVKSLKGKIDFAGNIRYNIVHKERFYTTHQVYDYDHLLHHVLYRALEIIEQFCRGSYLYDSCRRLMLNFPEVSNIKIGKEQLDKIVLNRKTYIYSYAVEIARLIILNYSPDISSGKERMLSLLFDMNKLWEEYILVQLRKVLENTAYSVTGQDTRPFINSNYLQPDIIISNKYNKNEIYVIDTKWKKPINGNASVEDLRQVYTYNRFWKSKKAMLLYPGTPDGKSFNYYRTDDYNIINGEVKEIQHLCKIGYVNVFGKNDRLNDKVGEEVLNLLEEDESFKKNVF